MVLQEARDYYAINGEFSLGVPLSSRIVEVSASEGPLSKWRKIDAMSVASSPSWMEMGINT